MRRRVGVDAFAYQKRSEEKFKDKKSEINESSVEELQVQLNQLKDKLQWFAAKHQQTLKSDSVFRHEFIQMCASIGVDPLASSRGFWTEFLGVGTFYYQLAVQAIEMVLAGSAYHGGIMRLEDLWKQLIDSRSSYLQDSGLSCNDVVQAFDMLDVLGKSCGVITTDEKQVKQSIVFCVPEELSFDHTLLIQTVAQSGKACFVNNDLAEELGWPELRINSAIEKLLQEGIIWLDSNDDKSGGAVNHVYWFPGLFFDKMFAISRRVGKMYGIPPQPMVVSNTVLKN